MEADHGGKGWTRDAGKQEAKRSGRRQERSLGNETDTGTDLPRRDELGSGRTCRFESTTKEVLRKVR